MWQRFTERARRIIYFAQEEAGRLNESAVSPEHILLGLAREQDSIAARVLNRMGIKLEEVRAKIEGQLVKSSVERPAQDMQLTPASKKVIDLAYEEARRLKNGYIGSEHVLLGLIAENDSIAARALVSRGADLQKTREMVEVFREHQPSTQKVISMEIVDAMKGKDLVSIRDLSADEICLILGTAKTLKSKTLEERVSHPILAGKTLAMVFEKPSLRTRVSFEVGMTQLGGHAIYLQPSDIKMGERETVADTARNLDRMVDGIMARTFSHQTVLDLAKHSKVPVINGLSDLEHPCQALADFLTIQERKGDLSKIKLAFIGDGCNTCHSLMLLAAKVGADMSVGCPEGYEPDTAVLTSAQRIGRETGAIISVTDDPYKAVSGADAVYTDVWTSMGLEAEKEQRMAAFRPYQVNQALMDAADSEAVVLHCLPAHRGEEITDEVMDGPQSVVFDQAENRLHAQKAIMALLM